MDEFFPASDPPSWTLGTDHGKKESAMDDDTRASQENKRRCRKNLTRRQPDESPL